MMKKLVTGIMAHVDAGKTSLSEGLLYTAGVLRRMGRVDHGDAFLDTDALERERGITIFSKQAQLTYGDREITLLDTPGHVDFSAEMERTLQVLDCATLVISGSEGIQGHTRTLWRLLRQWKIPTFLFINKMDLASTDRTHLLEELKRQLDDGCVDALDSAALQEAAATGAEELLERYLEGEIISDEAIAGLVEERKLFPCVFGSALRLEGVEAFLQILARFAPNPIYPEHFAARVFKIARDGGDRLTYMKITGGTLRVRTLLTGSGAESWQEKVHQIRIYSGEKYRTVEEVQAGTICAVTGLTQTRPGDGLGAETEGIGPALEPVLRYRLILPEGTDIPGALSKLRQLEEEDPTLHIVWDEQLQEIHLQLMGEVQLEILTRLIQQRFGLKVAFGEGSIVYKETLAAPVIGIGHFEPLRHYAEVHLLLEPGKRGSGMEFASACPTDQLDGNWQRLILTHLAERTHKGVLTGSPLTDVKITLLAGRAHIKHTEGGDFRQATYRAVRQGLMSGESILLEPWYDFRLEVPTENVGRAMADLQQMGGSFDGPEQAGEDAVLTGSVPVAAIRGYWKELAAYSKGRGRLSCSMKGYAPCGNSEAVISAIGYEPERDLDHTPDSVFCQHGAGFVVKWDQVPQYAHVDSGLRLPVQKEEPARFTSGGATQWEGDKELEAIFVRTYGPIKNRGMEALAQRRRTEAVLQDRTPAYVQKDDCLLVDGYNIIFAWEELNHLAQRDLEDARNALLHIMCNYQGMKGCQVTVVFDAYRVKGGTGASERRGNVDVVYTKEGETADMYIERRSYELSRTHSVKVATSDTLEQVMVLGHGARRLSAKELRWEIEQADEKIRTFLREQG